MSARPGSPGPAIPGSSLQSTREKFGLAALAILSLISWSQTDVSAKDASSKKSSVALAQKPNISFRNEVQHAIDKGLAWLEPRQQADGSWSTADHPSLTALVLTANMGDPSERVRTKEPEFIRKGYAFLLQCVQPDGGIYRKELVNYNTSIGMMALLAANRSEYDSVLRNARRFVIAQQGDLGEKDKEDHPFDGGIGYGSKVDHYDLSNTLMALEALYYSKHLKEGGELAQARDLNWQAVTGFIQRCQNLPSHNKEPWASDDPQNKGGFVYYPGHSMAGEMKLPSGKTALRSYGSMSYAGLLSYIYADLKRDDPRVAAAFEWLQKNYSLDENPGMGAQGLYYYYHTMAKALTACGTDMLKLSDGRTIRWRDELALKLLNLQNQEGFWVSENARWWEKDPVLVTSYALIALEILYRGL